MVLQCTFAPQIVSSYNLQIPCYFYHENVEQDMCKKRKTLQVVATAINGVMTSEPSMVEFGTILVNTIVEKDITLFNPSECDVFYTLEVHGYENGVQTLFPNSIKGFLIIIQDSELEVIQRARVLPARSNETVKVKACVRHERPYEFRIYYKADSKDLK